MGDRRVLLIDPNEARRQVLSRRLAAQGHVVEEMGDPAGGADSALAEPPRVVVAQLWMPTVSGVQLCRLLRAEPATAHVPIILCGDADEPRSRFWAERAGASHYILNGRTGDLMRAIERTGTRDDEGFFVHLSGGSVGILDRIARHLDTALFDAVIASELRALANAGSLERLFDGFAQLMSQLTRYRWLALATEGRLALHHAPAKGARSSLEALQSLGFETEICLSRIEDHDAIDEVDGPPPLVSDVLFAGQRVARLAIAPCRAHDPAELESLVAVVARELGGAVRMAALIEESHLLATTDALTRIMNRRAFVNAMAAEQSRAARYGCALSVALFDIDHFKHINDRHGHAAGDEVLSAVGRMLQGERRESDLVARWGGEEFVVAFTSTDVEGAKVAAERLRAALESIGVTDDEGTSIPVTASFGIATYMRGETLEALIHRADRAMYRAKTAGRNRVMSGSERPAEAC